MPRAEEETLKAVHLAQNGWELSLARKQLQEIRRLIREGTQKPTWTKSLKVPALVLSGYGGCLQPSDGGDQMRWNLFAGCAVMVGYVMFAMGAPLFTVIMGVGLAGAWNVMEKTRSERI